MKKLHVPRIISIQKHERTLLDFIEEEKKPKQRVYGWDPEFRREAKSFMEDKDILILVLWAIISPAAALAYLVWTRYNQLRLLALPLAVLAIVQFSWQWGSIIKAVIEFMS
ncbi:hypothetical protein AUJ15_01395 [Candidatus Micrarchaeota archaeon CG1_02_55_41]|nr:MAG: hypothetical protein AUJ15_01395 [Candidatus Micrarchaeota archaeon CG1_02_55_41]